MTDQTTSLHYSEVSGAPLAKTGTTAISYGGDLDIPEHAPKTLPQALLKAAAQEKEQGMLYIRADDIGVFQSYADLLETAKSILAGLQAKGFRPGDKVILQTEDLGEHFSTFWACVLGGIIPVTVAVSPSFNRNSSLITKLYNAWKLLGHPSVLTHDHLIASLSELVRDFLKDADASEDPSEKPGVLSVEELREYPGVASIHNSTSDDLAFFQLTSGSTGIPKCVQITHGGIIAHSHGVQRFDGHTPDDITLNWLPTDHVGAILMFHLKDVYVGCRQIHAKTSLILSNPLKWLDLIEAYHVTHTWAPNFGYKLITEQLSKEPSKKRDISSIKSFLNGGEQVTWPVIRDFLEQTAEFGVSSNTMEPAFGMAETCTGVVCAKGFDLRTGVHRILKSSLEGELQRAEVGELQRAENDVAVTTFVDLGPPIPGVHIRITDQENHPLPEGVIGRVQIKGRVITPGYYKNDKANKEAFVGDGWFDSGDLGFILNGRLCLTGRSKEMIVVRGANLYCHEIEDVINRVNGVEPTFSAACSVADPNTGTEVLAIFFVPKSPDIRDHILTIRRIRTEIGKNMGITPDLVIPVAMKEFPKTTSGKIQRIQMKKSLEAGEYEELLKKIALELENENMKKEHIAPRTEKEKILAKVWAETFNVARVGIYDNFFSLGGDSIISIRIISKAAEHGLFLTLKQVFEHQTLAELAMSAETEEQAPEQAGLAGETSLTSSDFPLAQALTDKLSFGNAKTEDVYPATPMQQGMLFHTLYEPASDVYFEQIFMNIKGHLDGKVFQKAWQNLADRHPVFRTAFISEGLHEPLQVVYPFAKLPFTEHDKTDLSEAMRETWLSEFLAKDRSRGVAFDKPPLMRCHLIRFSEADHIFILSYHHALMDGWCIPLILNEVISDYTAVRSGKQADIPCPRPYRDYISWLVSRDNQAAEAFWRKELEGFASPTPLGIGRPAHKGTPVCEDKTLKLSTELSDDLRAFGRKHRITPNLMLQAAWSALLHRYSGEEDIVFGLTVSGRPPELAGVENMIGLFINTIPVRTKISGKTDAVSLMKELQKRYPEREQYSFSSLSDIQRWSDVPGGTSLFESILVFENYSTGALLAKKAGGPDITDMQAVEHTNYPLALGICFGDILTLNIVYDKTRFDDESVTGMLKHLRKLIQGMVAEPDGNISDLPVLTKQEHHKILTGFNDTKADYPKDKCIHQLFEEQAERTPDAVAVIFEDKQLTYKELNESANQLGHYLQKLGVGSEVMVGICMERSAEMITGLLGILKAGGAYVPLDPDYPRERLGFMLEDTQMPILLTQASLAGSLPKSKARLVCLDTDWEAVVKESKKNVKTNVRPDNLTYVIYTSGSTGKPKGVLVEHGNVVNLIVAQEKFFKIDETDRILQFYSLCFDASAEQIWLALSSGAALVLVAKERLTDKNMFERYIFTHNVTHIDAVPSFLNNIMFLKSGKIRRIITGAEVCPVGLARRLACDFDFYNNYGPSEASVTSTIYAITQETPLLNQVPIGRPIANTQVYILGTQLKPLPIGASGELHIGGKGLARGYLNRPDLTKEKFIPNPFSSEPGDRLYKTGDLCRYLPDGNIEFLGRADHQVKIRGFRIEMGEIETVLSRHGRVKEAVVIAREDQHGNKQLAAYLTPKEERESPEPVELREFLKATLPDYMIPAAFVILEALPLTPSGKVDRKALPASDSDIMREHEFVGPRNETEEIVAEIWKKVLNLEKISIHDNFFEIGGNSLLSMQLVSRIEKQFSDPIPVSAVFENSTIVQMSQLLSKDKRAFSPLVKIQPGGEEIPFFCVHPVGGTVFCYADLVRSLGAGRPFYGLQSSGINKGEKIFTRIEDMAAYYAEVIGTVGQESPYIIGGWSLGGLIAFEMAQQLQTAGHEAAMLVLIDSYTPALISEYEEKTDQKADALFMMLKDMEGLLGKKIPEELKQSDKDAWPEHILMRVSELGIMPPGTDYRQMRRLFNVFKANLKAVKNYKPRHYSGKAVLFSSAEKIVKTEDPAQGWGEFVSRDNLYIRQVPGDHYTMLREPDVLLLAEEMNQFFCDSRIFASCM